MDVDLAEAARLLKVDEETVRRLVREAALPSHRGEAGPRFDRAALRQWATARGHQAAPELFAPAPGGAEMPALGEALRRGGVHRDLPGDTVEAVLREVTRLPGIPRAIDRTTLLKLLLGREALASTGLGGGIAVPHPRDPAQVHIAETTVLLCFLAKPIDWHSLDGQPVTTVFTLLSISTKAHLQTLARLAFGLRDPTFKRLLDTRAEDEHLLARAAALDACR